MIEKAKLAMADCYFNPMKYGMGRVFFHEDKPLVKKGRPRKMRSELREPISHRVGVALLHYTNLEMMSPGYFDRRGNFINLGISALAGIIGISLGQMRASIRNFQKHGYLTIEENRYMNSDGEYRSGAAFIRVSKDFYLHLGITSEEFDAYRQRKNAEEEARKKYLDEIDRKKTAMLEMKDIRKILARYKNGHHITESEKMLLEREYPGYDRKRTRHGPYRDFTGIAERKDDPDFIREVLHGESAHNVSRYVRKIMPEDDPPFT